jgi:asparagine synthase (glutamine-hydrolysing)
MLILFMIWKFFLALYLIAISKLLEWIPSWTYPSLKFAANLLPISDDNMSFGFKSKKFTSCLGFESDYRHQLWLGSFDPNQKNKLYNKNFINVLNGSDPTNDLISNHMEGCDSENNWERSMWIDMRFYLQDN